MYYKQNELQVKINFPNMNTNSSRRPQVLPVGDFQNKSAFLGSCKIKAQIVFEEKTLHHSLNGYTDSGEILFLNNNYWNKTLLKRI